MIPQATELPSAKVNIAEEERKRLRQIRLSMQAERHGPPLKPIISPGHAWSEDCEHTEEAPCFAVTRQIGQLPCAPCEAEGFKSNREDRLASEMVSHMNSKYKYYKVR